MIEDAGVCYLAPATDWERLFNRDDQAGALAEMTRHAPDLAGVKRRLAAQFTQRACQSGKSTPSCMT